jgi:hypothetical protein
MPGTFSESTRPGLRAFRSTCASAVSQEVLAPFRVARSLSPNRVDTAGRARGLCGAPDSARGRRADSLALHRLDPDGWLVQSSTDTNPIQSPAAQQRAESATFNPPSPRSGSPGASLAKPCPRDTRLLMGAPLGTARDRVSPIRTFSACFPHDNPGAETYIVDIRPDPTPGGRAMRRSMGSRGLMLLARPAGAQPRVDEHHR